MVIKTKYIPRLPPFASTLNGRSIANIGNNGATKDTVPQIDMDWNGKIISSKENMDIIPIAWMPDNMYAMINRTIKQTSPPNWLIFKEHSLLRVPNTILISGGFVKVPQNTSPLAAYDRIKFDTDLYDPLRKKGVNMVGNELTAQTPFIPILPGTDAEWITDTTPSYQILKPFASQGSVQIGNTTYAFVGPDQDNHGHPIPPPTNIYTSTTSQFQNAKKTKFEPDKWVVGNLLEFYILTIGRIGDSVYSDQYTSFGAIIDLPQFQRYAVPLIENQIIFENLLTAEIEMLTDGLVASGFHRKVIFVYPFNAIITSKMQAVIDKYNQQLSTAQGVMLDIHSYQLNPSDGSTTSAPDQMYPIVKSEIQDFFNLGT